MAGNPGARRALSRAESNFSSDPPMMRTDFDKLLFRSRFRCDARLLAGYDYWPSFTPVSFTSFT